MLLTITERSRGPAMPPPRSKVRSPSRAQAPLRVLVADDYEDARAMFAEYLGYSGFEVAVARDGREAVDLARAARPDVVLMDLAMPTLDGTGALRLLREDPATRAIPVVACTGQLHGREIDEARRAGFDAMLLKPVVLADLVATLRMVIGRER